VYVQAEYVTPDNKVNQVSAALMCFVPAIIRDGIAKAIKCSRV
jgi:hypothetical protein